MIVWSSLKPAAWSKKIEAIGHDIVPTLLLLWFTVICHVDTKLLKIAHEICCMMTHPCHPQVFEHWAGSCWTSAWPGYLLQTTTVLQPIRRLSAQCSRVVNGPHFEARTRAETDFYFWSPIQARKSILPGELRYAQLRGNKNVVYGYSCRFKVLSHPK